MGLRFVGGDGFGKGLGELSIARSGTDSGNGGMMEHNDRIPVLERLLELQGWAEYIFEALHWDRKSEPVKREMLERVVDLEALRQIRELSWALWDKLHLAALQLDLSHQK